MTRSLPLPKMAPTAPSCSTRPARHLSAAGDGPGAIARWRSATEEAPESNPAYLALVEIVNRNADFDLYQRGYIDLYADAYEPAIAAFQAYLDATDASDARHANALHRLGQSYLGAGNYAEAIARLDEVIAKYPDCDCFGLAWLHKAMAQEGMGDTAAARRTYRTFARDYPDDEQAPEALWLSGRMAFDEGNQLEAAVDFMALADRFPASDRAPQALYALGIGAITKQLYGQAAPVLERLQASYPDYRWDAAAYWLGRAYAGSGNDEGARAAWQGLVERAPDIYYGVLAGYALHDIAMTNAAALASMDKIAGPTSRLEGDDGSQAFAEQWLRSWITDTAIADLPSLAELPMAVEEDQNLAKGRLLLGDGPAWRCPGCARTRLRPQPGQPARALCAQPRVRPSRRLPSEPALGRPPVDSQRRQPGRRWPHLHPAARLPAAVQRPDRA